MDRAVPKQRLTALLGKFKYPIAVVLAGLVLMLLPGKEPPAQIIPAETAPEEDLEHRLEALLAQIEGAGEVRVLLTREAGPETLYQTDSRTDSGAGRSDDTVLVEDAARTETGLIRQMREAQYRGAVILCQGADRPGVKLAIVEAVGCVTGLGADRISVLKLK